MLEVPDEGLGADDFGGGGDNVVLLKQATDLLGERFGHFAEVTVQRKKAIRHAEVVHTGDGGFRTVGGLDDEADRHRGQRFVLHGPVRLRILLAAR
jgi:hypothetical protein